MGKGHLCLLAVMGKLSLSVCLVSAVEIQWLFLHNNFPQPYNQSSLDMNMNFIG